MGGGSESSSNYFQSEVCLRFHPCVLYLLTALYSCLLIEIGHQIVFLGIDNIHAMRESLVRLRDYLDTHGTTSSDGISSFLVLCQILDGSILLMIVRHCFGYLEVIPRLCCT